jgi:Transcriptional regulator, AbiEi antitoxin
MADENVVGRAIRGKSQPRAPERLIAELAMRQHGVVARRQLLDLGIAPDVIDRRVKRGTLHAVHHGAYAVGHRNLTQRSHFMAAVLAGGRGAVLSHTSAAQLWGIEEGGWKIHVTVPRALRSRGRLVFHSVTLPSDEVTELEGIPVTTAARTLFDCAATLSRRRLERVMSEAEYRRLTDTVPLPALIERYTRHRGTRNLRAILATGRLGLDRTRSELEDRFLAFVDDRDLPRPEVNAVLDVGAITIEADFLWRRERVIVELDGRNAHERVSAFQSDRSRDLAAPPS